MTTPAIVSSVPNVNPYIQYISAGGQTVFPYPFPVTLDGDLIVIVNGITLATDQGYTVSGVGNASGGNITFTLGQTAGAIITVYRNIAIQRITQITQNSGYSSTALNAEYNNIYMILQQLQESISLSLQIPNTNNPTPTTILTPAAWAGKYMSFDSNGNPVPAVAIALTTLTAALIAGLLQPQTPGEIAASAPVVQGQWPPGVPDRYQINATPLTTDMSFGWQKALDSTLGVWGLPGSSYGVNPNAALISEESTVMCLGMRSGHRINLNGSTVKVLSSAGDIAQSFGPIFGNVLGVLPVGLRIENGTIDCNSMRSGIIVQSGIDCDIANINVKRPGSSGIGLGHRSNYPWLVAGFNSGPFGRNTISKCRVDGALFISVECSQQTIGLSITDCDITNSVDNAIDIYGNSANGGAGGALSVNITNITQDATGATITYTSANAIPPVIRGLELNFASIVGMTQMNGLWGTVINVAGSSPNWTAKVDIDSSGFTPYASGGTANIGGTGGLILIAGNRIRGVTGDCGIFMESVPNFILDDNTVQDMTATGGQCVVLNSIISAAFEGLVTNNRLKNARTGGGLFVQRGGKIRVADNSFKNLKWSIALRNGAQFCSIGVNTHEAILGKSLIIVDPQPANGFIWSHIASQDYFGVRDANGRPFTISPVDNAVNYSNRTFFPRQTAATNYLQAGGAAAAAGGFSDLQVEYQDGASGVLTNGLPGPAFSQFTGGETHVIPTVVGSAWVDGDFMQTGTVQTLYQMLSHSGGNIILRKPSILTTAVANIAAGSFTVGVFYSIATVGTTDFTLIAAANNNVGTGFVATGVGTGTGTATPSLGTGSTKSFLSSVFTGVSGAYVTVMSGVGTFDQRAVTYTNGSAAISWSGGLSAGNYPGINILGLPGDYTANLTAASAATGFFTDYQTL